MPMAIFKKLINTASSRKTSVANSHADPDCFPELDNLPELSPLCCSPYKKLRREMLRLVIFSHANRLIYDSETVISVKDRIVPDSPQSKCGGFQYLPHANDTAQMAKMVFGTSSKPDSFKVHTLVNMNALMVSRVFPVSKNARPTTSNTNGDAKCAASSVASSDSADSQSHYSTIRSLDALRESAGGAPSRRSVLSKTPSYSSADPPDGFARIRNSSLHLDGGGNNDDDTLADELHAFSPNRLSRARRRQLSLKGLCDDGSSLLSSMVVGGGGGRSRMSSCCSENNTPANGGVSRLLAQQSLLSTPRQDAPRHYGVALLFPSEDKEFIFRHILQVEADMFKLIERISTAIRENQQFLKLTYEAWLEFCASTCLLHNSLRLKAPVWLSLTNPMLQDRTAADFCRTLAKLSDTLNTKDTKFFLATLVSATLTNHLSWVASVAPPESCSYDRSLLLGTSVIDSRRNPYNAMAAQFVELSGSIGVDSPTARTLVVGENPLLVAEILYILSYFIRCSSVENKRKEILTPDSLSPLKSFVEESSVEIVATKARNELSRTRNSNSISIADDSPSYSPDDAQHSLTPPPTKIRAVGSAADTSANSAAAPPFASAKLLKQSSNASTTSSSQQRACYELIVDAKQVATVIDCCVPAPGSAAAATAANVATTSASRSHLELNGLERPSDFGRTLLAGVCSAYSPHFVLSGVDRRRMNFDEAYLCVYRELCSPNNFGTHFASYSNDGVSRNLLSPSAPSLSTPLSNSRGDGGGLMKRFYASTQTTENADVSGNYGNNKNGHANGGGEFSVPTCVPHFAVPYGGTSPMNCASVNGMRTHAGTSAENGDGSCGDATSQRGSTANWKATAENKPVTVVIMADCSSYTVKVVSGSGGDSQSQVEECEMTSPSETVASMLEEFVELYKQKCAATFLISFLEDRLGSVLSKSNVLVGLINGSESELAKSVSGEKLAAAEDLFASPLASTSGENLALECVEHCGVTGPTAVDDDDVMEHDDDIDFDDNNFYAAKSVDENGTAAKLGGVLECGKTVYESLSQSSSTPDFISMEQMSKLLDCHCSDLRLILNVASVYSPAALSSAI